MEDNLHPLIKFFKELFNKTKKDKTEEEKLEIGKETFNLLHSRKLEIQKISDYKYEEIIKHKKEAIKYKRDGNKENALISLKRKHNAERAKINYDNMVSSLECNIDTIEQCYVNSLMTDSLIRSKQTMNKIIGVNDIDNTNEAMDDIIQHVNDISEISSNLSDMYKEYNNIDEDELEKELNELIIEKEEKEEKEEEKNYYYPIIPMSSIKFRKDKEPQDDKEF